MAYTDSHAHLSLVAQELGPAFVGQLLDEYDAAWAASGGAGPLVLDPGVEADDLPARRAAAGRHPFLRYAAGIWPSSEALADPAAHLGRLAAAVETAAATGEAVAAIGEGGLDYHHMNGDGAAQRELFSAQVELADRLDLPMIVHSRDAAADTLDVLRSLHPRIPVVLHCYGYGPDELGAFLALGCFISFAGNLSYRSAARLREACAAVPLERLLLETDSPYLNPEPRRGRPSSPFDIERTYEIAARLRSLPVEELAAIVSANARQLFG